MGPFGDKTREAILKWFGHVRRKDDGYIERMMQRMELPEHMKRGKPKRRITDVVRVDMAVVEVTEGCRRYDQMELYTLIWRPRVTGEDQIIIMAYSMIIVVISRGLSGDNITLLTR